VCPDILRARGHTVDLAGDKPIPGAELKKVIGAYDALIIRRCVSRRVAVSPGGPPLRPGVSMLCVLPRRRRRGNSLLPCIVWSVRGAIVAVGGVVDASALRKARVCQLAMTRRAIVRRLRALACIPPAHAAFPRTVHYCERVRVPASALLVVVAATGVASVRRRQPLTPTRVFATPCVRVRAWTVAPRSPLRCWRPRRT
jgi:hypothetical protein